MKTNRTSIRRLALLAGTFCLASQGSAHATVAKPATQIVGAVKTVAVEPPRVLMAFTSCTRVGNRMVC